LVFAGFDGVVVIPRSVEDRVIQLAAEKVGKENATRGALLQGRTLRDVFNEFGVL
jgi:regulator of RNase E activity RraA